MYVYVSTFPRRSLPCTADGVAAPVVPGLRWATTSIEKALLNDQKCMLEIGIKKTMDQPLLSSDSAPSVKPSWNKADIYKLSICWALTLTTSTLLTVSTIVCNTTNRRPYMSYFPLC